jgi:cell division protease FtsH
MSENNQKKSKGKRQAAGDKKKPNSHSGLVTLLVMGGVFILLQFFSSREKSQFQDITQLEFRKAVTQGVVTKVERVRETDSEKTFLLGEMKPSSANGKARLFRVVLVPRENEELMLFMTKHNLNCPIKEKEPVIGPLLMQALMFLLPIALIYWFLAKRMSDGNSPFSMGKSKAKLLNEDNKGKKRITFKDVAGVDEAREEVQEIIEFLKGPEKFKKLGGRIPKGVLLVGPPGTGKTLLAKAIAGEAEVPFFSLSGSDFEEMFVGVGASRVRDMFEQGKKHAPCLIFIDEIDAVGHKRSTNAMSGAQVASEQTLNAMLVEMDGFDANEGVIIIAATNRPDVLDPALLRPGRFDRQIYVDLPTLKGREDILNLHGKKIKFAPDADLKRIARGTPGFSGADLANLLNEAALLAARKELDGVTYEVLEEARDKVLWGRERRSAGFTKKEREITAWHEAGHALVQLLLEHTDPLHKVTVIPRGRALGATMSLPKKDILNRTKAYYLDNLCVCAGGRIAEEMFTNDISTGAAQDIRMATSIARNMVCLFGMSDKFGFQAFQEPNSFTSEELPPAFSSKTAEAIDAEVESILKAAYSKAEKLLKENRDKLELLAKTLVEKESMDGRDVEKLVGIEKSFDDELSEKDETLTPPAEGTSGENA